MPVYKVNYFDNRGRAETLRMILALKEQQFTDRRIAPEDWGTISNTEAPMGHLPFLEVDSVKLVESCAIIRYLGRELGLIGKTSIEAAQIDGLVCIVEDLMSAMMCIAFTKIHYLPTEKASMYKTFYDSESPKLLQKLENQLLRHDNGQGFLTGSEITVADIHFYSYVDMVSDHDDIFPGFMDPYPALQGLKQRIRIQPNLKEYLDVRKQTLV